MIDGDRGGSRYEMRGYTVSRLIFFVRTFLLCVLQCPKFDSPTAMRNPINFSLIVKIRTRFSQKFGRIVFSPGDLLLRRSVCNRRSAMTRIGGYGEQRMTIVMHQLFGQLHFAERQVEG